MEDRLSQVEAQIRALAEQVRVLERRTAALEAQGIVTAQATVTSAEPEAAGPPASLLAAAGAVDATTALSLIGRTFVVLAGAFLLRALTDSGALTPGRGVAIGMAYAFVWIAMADRAGARGRRASASFHGLAFVLIGLPLLLEATLRFRLPLLSTPASAAALGVFAAVSLAAAWRQRMRGLAWITTLGVVATAAVFMTMTGELAPFAICLVLLGVATLWFGYVLDWVTLRWPVAFVTDLTLLALSLRAVGSRSPDTPAMALVAQMLLLALYLGSFATRTLFLNRDIIPFEVVQSVAALTVGLGGAAYVTRVTGVGATPLGLASLVLGLGCYGVALVFVERRQRRRKNFHFYTAAALVFTMTGCALALSPTALALAWAALAIIATGAGLSLGSLTLRSHAAVYAFGATLADGLFAHAAHGLGWPMTQPWPPVSSEMLVVLTAIAACAWVLITSGPGPYPRAHTRVPGVVLLVLSVSGVMGVVIAWLAPVLIQTRPSDTAGVIATLRTAALVAATLGLASAARPLRLVEAGWLVYPLLVVTGVKFLFEDFRTSRPATLFVAFALYGVALILAPRLRRRT